MALALAGLPARVGSGSMDRPPSPPNRFIRASGIFDFWVVCMYHSPGDGYFLRIDLIQALRACPVMDRQGVLRFVKASERHWDGNGVALDGLPAKCRAQVLCHCTATKRMLQSVKVLAKPHPVRTPGRQLLEVVADSSFPGLWDPILDVPRASRTHRSFSIYTIPAATP
ncbi:hypothetical protein M426DRAFT_261998 [Hypoxylon sp. CI-4A]|nr:hypothetical protein M426DRAFT_261998 [Hypoxylon sp. CI-4A]